MTIRKIIRTSQPQTPCGIDWSNPVTQGLASTLKPVKYFPYAADPGGSNRVSNPSDTFRPNVSIVGTHLSNAGSRFVAIEGKFDNLTSISGGYTQLCIVQANKIISAEGEISRLAGTGSGGDTTRTIEISTGTSGEIIAKVLRYQDTPFSNIIGPSLNDGSLKIIVSTITPTRLTLYVNGIFINESSGLILSQGFTPMSSYLRTGGGGLPFSDDTIRIGLLSSWSRVLSNNEIKSLSDNPWQIFQPTTRLLYTPNQDIVLPSKGYPVKDLSKGLWTGFSPDNINSTLSDKLDEDTPNTSDYVYTDYPTTSEYELSETQFPGAGGYQLSYNASGATGAVITVKLRQGMTEIAQWQHPLTVVDTTYTQTLTPEQVALIVAGPVIVNLDVN